MRRRIGGLCFFSALLLAGFAHGQTPIEISGRFPHLAMCNREGECGVGAVVPWAGRLWVITYGPHLPSGSTDKLYEIDEQLRSTARPESVGGTPANRMIHRESDQLNIGPYFIDSKGNVRVISPKTMYGRLTATARHLTDPAHKLYIYDMEGLVYEVDVHTLAVKLLFKRPVPGWHGKGAYSGQGRLVLANNGCEVAGSVKRFKPFDYFIDPTPASTEDSGILAEWDGHTWRALERRQFTDVTGPGGIRGPASDKDPVWAIGWDKRSVMLKLCDQGGQWQTFRLPISDYSYVARHGWYTEWPRIREVGGGKFLLNMHGGWFDFPGTFAAGKTGGLRPLGDYLKITGDFCNWNGRLVFGCDDTTRMGESKGGVGDTLNGLNPQSNSNLWFTTWEGLSQAGRPAGYGGPWLRDDVPAGTPSQPYLLAGYRQRVLHLSHAVPKPVTFKVEIDAAGDGKWTLYRQISVPASGYVYHVIPDDVAGQWVRLTTDVAAHQATAYFHYGPGGGAVTDRQMFASLPDAGQPGGTGAWVRCEGDDRVDLEFTGFKPLSATSSVAIVDPAKLRCAWHVDAGMRFTAIEPSHESPKKPKVNVHDTAQVVHEDAASLIVREAKLQVRLPMASSGLSFGARQLREVVTERSLLNAGGSFFVLPRVSAGGLRRIKPLCTHNKQISDFCSWRGLLVLAGCRAGAKPDGHYFSAPIGGDGLWFGDIDDLWELGKPVGRGGPWHETAVKAQEPSDPYLMLGYDRKTLEIAHDAPEPVHFEVQVDVAGDGVWYPYQTLTVAPGKPFTHVFPAGYSAHWVRLQADRDCKATATFVYE